MLCAQPARGQTQESQAAEADKRARAEFAAGDYRAAALSFEKANALAPYPQLRFNAALAWERAGDEARAANGYESALSRGGLDAEREATARRALTVLKERLAYLQIRSPIGGVVSIGHMARAAIPLNTHLAPGEYTIAIEMPGGAKRSEQLVVRAGEVRELSFEESAPTVGPTPRREATTRERDPQPRSVETGSNRATWGWVMIGGAVALSGAATYTGLRTLQAADDYGASNETDADIRDEGVRYRTLTNIAIGGAAVCAGLGVYLLVSGDSNTTGSARLSLRARGDRVTASWTF